MPALAGCLSPNLKTVLNACFHLPSTSTRRIPPPPARLSPPCPPARPPAAADGLHAFATCMVSYGFMGDVMAESESYRWLGPLRYDVVRGRGGAGRD